MSFSNKNPKENFCFQAHITVGTVNNISGYIDIFYFYMRLKITVFHFSQAAFPVLCIFPLININFKIIYNAFCIAYHSGNSKQYIWLYRIM